MKLTEKESHTHKARQPETQKNGEGELQRETGIDWGQEDRERQNI